MEYETGECKSCEKLAEKIAAIERERDESRKWAAAQARFINKLEAENAGLQKAHDFWRDQCESFEAQLSGKIKENARLRKRLEVIKDDYLADKIAVDCHDKNHDDRWCPTCNARDIGIDEYRNAVNKEMELKEGE